MEKYADYIAKVFVEERSANFVTPGHEEIELALYRMYKTTGKIKFFELCRFFLENRGLPDNTEEDILDSPYYAQNHLPIREQKEAFGHSVRAVYLYSGMADLALETGDEKLKEACIALFDNITTKKMYVTGGIGSAYRGETFTVAYDLPNASAYAETCASIGLMFFAQRMIALDPENSAKYADARFNVTATYTENGSTYTKTFLTPQKCVAYSSILEYTEQGIKEWEAGDLGGNYLIALNVTDIPKSVGTVQFHVEIYCKSSGGGAVNDSYVVTATVNADGTIAIA